MSTSPEKLPFLQNVYRIDVPNHFSTETTNCYFIDGASPTLVDTGIATDAAHRSLLESLSELGRTVGDITRIVLTHGHADHRALGPKLQRESGAEVLCHESEMSKVVEISTAQEESRKSKSAVLFRGMGVPEDILPSLVETSKDPSVNPRFDNVSPINEGDEIRLDGITLKVYHTPGHSCGSICLYDKQSGTVFTGDTLLSGSHITALLETDIISRNPNYNGLKLHVDSLQRLLRLKATHVLPGHGPILDEYESIVFALLDRHRKRRRHILRSLRNGPRQLYQICRSTFLFVSASDLYLALSEVMGNIGILIEEEQVRQHREGEKIYYEKA